MDQTNLEDKNDLPHSKKEMADEWFLKIHLRTGHCDATSVQKLCRAAGISFDMGRGRECIRKCDCSRDDHIPQNPKISRRVSSFPGGIIEIDITYPKEEESQRSPALISVCNHSRFTMCKFTPNLFPLTIIAALLTGWVSLFGFPRLIISDQGTPLSGAEWREFLDRYSISMTGIPVNTPNQLGLCERHSALIKKSSQAVKRTSGSKWADREIMGIVS